MPFNYSNGTEDQRYGQNEEKDATDVWAYLSAAKC